MRQQAKKQGGFDSKHEIKFFGVLDQWRAACRIAFGHHPDPIKYGIIRERKYTFDFVVRWFDAAKVHRQAWLEVKGLATDYDRLRIEYFSECRQDLEIYFVELRGGRWTYRRVQNGKMELGVTSRSTQETKNRLATPPWER